ncbi:5-hydroxyisourate hydrolase [Sergentomyia squamirostris]
MAKPPISVHILDTSQGRPAAGVPITLFKLDGEIWAPLGGGLTNPDGRCTELLTRQQFTTGTYKIHYSVSDYLKATAGFTFYPYVEVVFQVDRAGDDHHYHIPLLLNPYGYSTYRGS